MDCVIYIRVSSLDQEEGYSLDAQRELLREYAHRNDLTILHEYVVTESAKGGGRQVFNQMIDFLKSTPGCSVLVEKTDRLYRNLKDWVTIDDLDIDVHFVKDGMVIGPNTRSNDKFFHGIKVLMAKNYIDNLREETWKGMNGKAKGGGWNHRAPFGYVNNIENHTIEIQADEAESVRWLFSQYATGKFSLKDLSKEFNSHGFSYRGARYLGKSELHRILRNPLYKGIISWGGTTYEGAHEKIISPDDWEKVQAILDNKSKPRKVKHDFDYKGVLKCHDCGHTVTAGLHKGHIYYRCTGSSGPCPGEKYVPQSVLDGQFVEALRVIKIGPNVQAVLRKNLAQLHKLECTERENEVKRLQKQYNALTNKIGAVYQDKLDGKIDPTFWQEQHNAMIEQRNTLSGSIKRYEIAGDDNMNTIDMLLWLADNAADKFLELEPDVKRQLIRTLLFNPTLEAGTPAKVHYTYKKPFDILAEGSKSATWQPQRDLNPCRHLERVVS